jgi:hypothetical protein
MQVKDAQALMSDPDCCCCSKRQLSLDSYYGWTNSLERKMVKMRAAAEEAAAAEEPEDPTLAAEETAADKKTNRLPDERRSTDPVMNFIREAYRIARCRKPQASLCNVPMCDDCLIVERQTSAARICMCCRQPIIVGMLQPVEGRPPLILRRKFTISRDTCTVHLFEHETCSPRCGDTLRRAMMAQSPPAEWDSAHQPKGDRPSWIHF